MPGGRTCDLRKAVEYSLFPGVNGGVKTKSIFHRLCRISLVLFAVGASVSCMTTYDSAGRPVQSVDPGLAIAGVAAAGVLGYALADDNHHHHGYYGGGGYYRPRPYSYGGYSRGGYHRYH